MDKIETAQEQLERLFWERVYVAITVSPRNIKEGCDIPGLADSALLAWKKRFGNET